MGCDGTRSRGGGSKLSELDGRFLKYDPRSETWIQRRDGVSVAVSGIRTYLKPVESLAEADGIMFLCPRCWKANGGSLEALAHWRELAAEAEAVVAEIQGLRWAGTELVAEGAD